MQTITTSRLRPYARFSPPLGSRPLGALTVEGEPIPLVVGQAAFVPAGAEHQFTGYEGLSVLVVFARQKEPMSLAERQRQPYPV